jgi:hypothetical protein
MPCFRRERTCGLLYSIIQVRYIEGELRVRYCRLSSGVVDARVEDSGAVFESLEILEGKEEIIGLAGGLEAITLKMF